MFRLRSIAIASLLLGVSYAHAGTSRCAELFVPAKVSSKDSVWLSEMIALHREIAESSGALKVALKQEWQQRHAALDAQDAALLEQTLRGSLGRIRTEKSDVEADALKAQRLSEADELSFFRRSTRRAVVEGRFEFANLRHGFLDADEYVNRHKLISQPWEPYETTPKAGVEWGQDGNFAAIRESERSQQTIIVDLITGEQRVLPAVGRLSVEGNLFIQGVSQNSRVYRLKDRQTFDLPGWFIQDRYGVTDHAVITRRFEPQNRTQIARYFYHDLRGPKPVTVELGSDIVANPERTLIATFRNDRIQIFDTRTMKYLDHPISKRKIHGYVFPTDLRAGFVEFTEKYGIPGFKRERRVMLSLFDLKVHPLSDRGLEWDALEGTDLMIASYKDKQNIPKAAVRSLMTGEEFHINESWPRVYRYDQEIWIVFGRSLFRQDKDSFKLTEQVLPASTDSMSPSGLLQKVSDRQLHLVDPSQNSMVTVHKPAGKGRVLVLRDQQKLLFAGEATETGTKLYGIDFQSQILQESEPQYVSFSRDSKWVAIEKLGKIEFHRLSP